MYKSIYSKMKETKICLEWKDSGLTKKEFCKKYNITTDTLRSWLKKRKMDINNSNLNSDLDFLPIKKRPPDCHIASEVNQTSIDSTMVGITGNKVEIILPNKITLKITLEPNETINFIKGLLSCNLQ
jgi:hypothetical protein